MVEQPHQHPRRLGAAHAVTPLELFFDLVFVFALTQVTGLLAEDLTWGGMVRGLAILTVVWWAWVGYAWLTNTVTIDDDVASRLVLLVAMAAMLVVGLAVPGAFGDAAIVFGVAYLVVRVLHLLLYAVTTRSDPEVFRAVARLAPGMLAGAIAILIAGFLPPGPLRALLWASAIVVDLGAPLIAGTAGWKVDAHHFAERHGLIIIIALGESLIAVGLSAADQPLSGGLVAAALLSITLIAGMWWLYFDVVAVAAERMLASLSGRAQAAMARDSYSYLHLPMIAGIILVALGLKKSMLDLDSPLKLIASVALFGGLALYLAAHLLFRVRNMGSVNVQRLVAAVLLVALMPLGTVVPALASVAAATTIVVGLVAFEAVRFREDRHHLRQHSPDQRDH